MIGESLLRYKKDQRFLIPDTESEGLNLAYHRPWELSYSVATLRDGIISSTTVYPWFDNLKVSADAARITGFNYDFYKANARPLQEVYEPFAALLYSPDILIAGHNLLGFDIYMLNNLRRALSLPEDDSWKYRVYDTDALSRVYKKGYKPEVATDEDRLSFMYKSLGIREKGLKSSIGAMCAEFGIEYDSGRAHGAEYDTSRNWMILKELIMRVEI